MDEFWNRNNFTIYAVLLAAASFCAGILVSTGSWTAVFFIIVMSFLIYLGYRVDHDV